MEFTSIPAQVGIHIVIICIFLDAPTLRRGMTLMFKKYFLVFIAFVIFAISAESFYYFSLANSLNHPPSVVHYSYFSQEEFYTSAYEQANTKSPDSNAKAILTNHHLLAAPFIAEAFYKIASNDEKTIVIISPNHFFTGHGSILTSKAIWVTPYGNISPDTATIKKLEETNLITIEEPPFQQEHGITGLVAFVKKSLPNAKIIPLIVRDDLPVARAIKIAETISKQLPRDAVLVGSVDFSHYLTHRASDFHDLENLNTVRNFDYNAIPRLDANMHAGLALFLKLLEIQEGGNFHLLEQNNSAGLAQDDSILETTSYITGYFTKGLPANKNYSTTLLALGNIDNNPTVLNSLDRHDPTFSVKFLERLFFGQKLTTVFIPVDEKLNTTLRSYKINTPITNSKVVDVGNFKVNFLKFSPSETNQTQAQTAIDQGADIVVGDSNKIWLEEYNNKLIIYGLGNLLTEKTLKSQIPATSLALGLYADGNNLSIYLLPIAVSRSTGKLLTAPSDAIVLTDIAKHSNVSAITKQEIKLGKINYGKQ